MRADTYFCELDPIEKLVFLYLLTNIHTNLCGIYEIPLRNISFDTWIEKQMIEKIINRFTRDKKIWYIDGYVCIRNFIKNQSINPSVKKWIERELNEKPKEIIDKVWQVYNLYTGCLQEGTPNLTLTKPKPNLTKPTVSKDTAVAEYGDPNINKLQELIENVCKENWILYSGKWAKERQALKRLLSKKMEDKLKTLNMRLSDLIKTVIPISTQLKYWKTLSSGRLIYYNREEIYNKAQKENLTNRSWVSKF